MLCHPKVLAVKLPPGSPLSCVLELLEGRGSQTASSECSQGLSSAGELSSGAGIPLFRLSLKDPVAGLSAMLAASEQLFRCTIVTDVVFQLNVAEALFKGAISSTCRSQRLVLSVGMKKAFNSLKAQ